MSDIARLRTFAAVASAGSIREGAAQASYSRQAVSKQLQGLERDLGTRLLDRGPEGVRLTSAGRRLLAALRPLLDFVESHDEAPAPTAPLRVGLTPDVVHDRMVTVLSTLPTTIRPTVTAVMDPQAVLAAVDDGRLDAAIGTLPGRRPADLVFIPIDLDRLSVVMPARATSSISDVRLGELASRDLSAPVWLDVSVLCARCDVEIARWLADPTELRLAVGTRRCWVLDSASSAAVYRRDEWIEVVEVVDAPPVQTWMAIRRGDELRVRPLIDRVRASATTP